MLDQSIVNDESFNNHICTICMKEDLNDEEIYFTNCDHEFCKSCLDDWFQRGNQSCPLCRTEIDTYKYKDENYKLIIHETINENETQINLDNTRELRRLLDTNTIFRTLAKQNARLRIYLFLTMSGFLLTFNNYLSLVNNYSELNKEYNGCMNDNTNLTDYLNNCLDSNLISGYYVNIHDGRFLRRCFYPSSLYDKCFE